jgi:transposase InsO family protein
MRLRAKYPNHVWSYDFVFIRDAYGGKIRMLTMIDEYTRRCLTIHCARRIGSIQVIEQLANAMMIHGIPQYIRSDNGPEFIAKELRSWLSGIGVKTAYIEPGSPWENGFCESFNGTFRDNLLDGEIFYSLKEAQIIVGEWVADLARDALAHERRLDLARLQLDRVSGDWAGTAPGAATGWGIPGIDTPENIERIHAEEARKKAEEKKA